MARDKTREGGQWLTVPVLLLCLTLALLQTASPLEALALPPLLRARQNYDNRRQTEAMAANVFLRFLRLTTRDIETNKTIQQCVWQGKSCDPFGVKCCDDMACLNLAWGYCIPGLEACRCLPVRGADPFAIGR